jgi:hypothetical protein
LLVAAATIAALAGCGRQRVLRPLVPWLFGMQRVSAQLWVEPGTPDSTRAALLRDLGLARLRLQRWYGPLRTRPVVVACVTASRAQAMGLPHKGARAHTLGDRAILAGPDALAERTLTHEWSHAELYRRLGGLNAGAIARVPRWFDEGLASAVSEDTAQAEAHWREIEARNVSTPSLNELVTTRQFAGAKAAYPPVRVDSLPHVNLVYATVAHEVLGWLRRAGPGAPSRLVDAMDSGESFAAAYMRLGGGAPER